MPKGILSVESRPASADRLEEITSGTHAIQMDPPPTVRLPELTAAYEPDGAR